MQFQMQIAVTQHGGTVGWAVGGACIFATALGGLRWLRVAQREHYLPDSASRFALRWWGTAALNQMGVVLALAGLVLASRWPGVAFAPAAVVAFGPLGLGLRGTTSPLRWTRRLRTLAAVWATIQVAVVLVGVFTGFAAVICAAGALAVPAIVDASCVVTAPLETRLADRYVKRARARLEKVKPKVVAITGSFGKTSTKGYVAHLLSGSAVVVASPASFNNRAGLAKAVNEHLGPGTDVFVAEMGTYGAGEIAELCSWMTPDVAVITAIGPVHLERFRDEQKIVDAKAEILVDAGCCVLVVDDPRLAQLAERAERGGKRVWRVSGQSSSSADVSVAETPEGLEVLVRGEPVARGLSLNARPGNVACAVAVALELGVPATEVAARLSNLPAVAHRLEPRAASRGFLVLDDTYNSNPAGARAALAELARATPDGGRRVVVTPGMVELGARQAKENELFAGEAAEISAQLVVVRRTNRRALVKGFIGAGHRAGTVPVLQRSREAAVRWVAEHLGPGDAVLYENDLPDHYP